MGNHCEPYRFWMPDVHRLCSFRCTKLIPKFELASLQIHCYSRDINFVIHEHNKVVNLLNLSESQRCSHTYCCNTRVLEHPGYREIMQYTHFSRTLSKKVHCSQQCWRIFDKVISASCTEMNVWCSDLQDHEFRLIACQPVLLQNKFKPGLIELSLVIAIRLRWFWEDDSEEGGEWTKEGGRDDQTRRRYVKEFRK